MARTMPSFREIRQCMRNYLKGRREIGKSRWKQKPFEGLRSARKARLARMYPRKAVGLVGEYGRTMCRARPGPLPELPWHLWAEPHHGRGRNAPLKQGAYCLSVEMILLCSQYGLPRASDGSLGGLKLNLQGHSSKNNGIVGSANNRGPSSTIAPRARTGRPLAYRGRQIMQTIDLAARQDPFVPNPVHYRKRETFTSAHVLSY